MTAEDKKKLIKACKLVKEVFPDMGGYLRINLHPERVKPHYNIYKTGYFTNKEFFEG